MEAIERVCMCMHLSNSLHLALKQIFVIFQPIYIILSTFIHRYARTYMHSEINTFWYFGNFALLDQCSCKCIDDTGKRDLSNAASLFGTVLEGKLLDRLMVYFFVWWCTFQINAFLMYTLTICLGYSLVIAYYFNFLTGAKEKPDKNAFDICIINKLMLLFHTSIVFL